MKLTLFDNKTLRQIDIKNICFALAIVGLIPGTLLSLAGYLGEFNRYLEITSHFKVQYLILSLIVFILLSLARRKTWWLVSLFCLTLNCVEVLPWYIPQINLTNEPPEQPLRVLLANVYSSNQRYSEFISLVRDEHPDLVVVQEVDPVWSQQLEALKSLLPYSLVQPRFDNFGIAVYSSLPLIHTDIKHFTDYDIPTIFTDINWHNQTVSVIATHPLPPINDEYFKFRNQQLLEISKYVNLLRNPQIVIGDLNTTMWSPYYRKFVRQSGLKNGRSGFGILPTWPLGAPMLQIPLDHCLMSRDIKVVDIRTGRDIGSDHLPLIADLI